MSWSWKITDLDGVGRGVLSPHQAVVTRNLNAASTIQLQIDADDSADLSTTARVLRGFRPPSDGGTRALRATGKVTGVNASVGTDNLERLTLTASDGMGVLASRVVANPNGLTYIQNSPRYIVNSLVEVENSRRLTGMYVAAGTAGPPRDRTYEQGKNVAEAIQQLAEVDDGFYYRVDPIDVPNPGFFSELVLLYPEAGSDSGASFEWGAGTVGNLAGVEADIGTPVNYVTAFGAGDGAEQIRASKVNLGSIEDLGLYDATITHSDVIETATLEQHALDALRPDEPRVFRVQVAPNVGNGGLYVPSPWDDFDVGDTVQLNLRGRSAALTYSGRALVTSFALTIDANGTERLTSLDFGER